MTPSRDHAVLSPGVMLLSAAIFGYFGYACSWAHAYTTDMPPRLLVMVSLLKWTMRVGAIAFLVAAALSLARSAAGPLTYAVAGLGSAAIFVMVAIWEWTNPKGYFSGVPAFLLLIFGIWNGYSSLIELRALLRSFQADRAATAESNPWLGES